MDYFAGLDISMEETHVCVLDREGVVVRESKAESTAEAISAELSKAPTCLRIVFETGRMAPILFHGLSHLGLPVVCVKRTRKRTPACFSTCRSWPTTTPAPRRRRPSRRSPMRLARVSRPRSRRCMTNLSKRSIRLCSAIRPKSIRNSSQISDTIKADIAALTGAMDAKLDALGERTDGVDARRRYDRNLSHREKDEAAQKAIAVAEVKAASLTIKEWRVAKEGYGATPIMSDGSPGAPLDLRELFSRYDAETAS